YAGPPRNPLSESRTLYSCASDASKNADAAPSKATIHIQKTAPGPPTTMAVATPAIFAVPIRWAADIVKAWKDEIPLEPSGIFARFSPSEENIVFSHLNCTKRVVNEKYSPAIIKSPINTSCHSKSFKKLTACSNIPNSES